MKQKRILALTLLFLIVFSTMAFAQERRMRSPVFMGEVQEVQLDEGGNILRIRAKGYIKGCKVYQEELVAIVSEETLIIPDRCSIKDIDQQYERVNPKEFKVSQGDTIYMVLRDAMTNSIPPQVGAKSIQVTAPFQ